MRTLNWVDRIDKITKHPQDGFHSLDSLPWSCTNWVSVKFFMDKKPKITYKKSLPCSPCAARAQPWATANSQRCSTFVSQLCTFPADKWAYYCHHACAGAHNHMTGSSWTVWNARSNLLTGTFNWNKAALISSLVKKRQPVNDLPVLISHPSLPLPLSSSAGICSNQGDPLHLAYVNT